jgi:hypothetical protein
MTGVIEGGWEFVWAAYGLSVLVLVAYGISVMARLRTETLRWKSQGPELDNGASTPPSSPGGAAPTDIDDLRQESSP